MVRLTCWLGGGVISVIQPNTYQCLVLKAFLEVVKRCSQTSGEGDDHPPSCGWASSTRPKVFWRKTEISVRKEKA